MQTLLHIKSSIFGDHGQSSLLATTFIKQWKELHSDGQVLTRDISAEPLPHFDAQHIEALMTDKEQRTAEQQLQVDLADQLIQEVKSASAILIAVPMYNFGIPSQLKAYFDRLARAGETFKYTETGPVGLIDDKPVYLLATRGGLYHDAGVDFQVPFVKQFFAFLGLTSTHTIYAEGLNMESVKGDSLTKAKQQINSYLSQN
jgi:FMN-dependent NADH-azoreductase